MSPQQRLILVIAILASFVAFLDGSVINVALPAISADLGGGLALQQWVVDAYLITLGALILLAGSLSDLFGRQRILTIGLLGFGVASLLCAIAPSGGVLIASRALQGVAGALLVPSSLAMIISAFSGTAQGKAIGSWTAWTGIAFIIGPLLGGLFVDLSTWRLVFAINIVPIAATLWLISKVKQKDEHKSKVRVDVVGALLCGLGLAATVFGLIEQARYGWRSSIIVLSLVLGTALLAGFFCYENRAKNPMLPMDLFKIRNFAFGNLATTSIYAGLSIGMFLVTIFVQQTGGYSAIWAGMALVPVTLILFMLSSKFGELSGKFGPRWFMTFGPITGAVGFALMLSVDDTVNYWTQLLPGIVIFGLGLAATVAPLTSAVLGSINSKQAGIGSAVNNAVARIAGLIGIALVGIVTGPSLNVEGFQYGLILVATLLFAGGIISAIGITNKLSQTG